MQSLKILIFFSVLFGGVAVNGQTVQTLPIQFGQFFNTYSIINPAFQGTNSEVGLELGQQRHGGLWKNISTSFISGHVRLGKRVKSEKFHVLGFSFLNDQEGEYLKRPRLYVNYAWHTQLTKTLSLSTGGAVGMAGYTVSATDAGAGGSDYVVDATVGIQLYSDLYYLGVSINQFTNSELTPIEQTSSLIRHLNVNGGHYFKLTQNLVFVPAFLIRYSTLSTDMDVAANGIINELVNVGINFRYERGLVPMVGFEKLQFGNNYFKAMFSYAFPMGKVSENLQTYELTIKYDYKRLQKKK